MDKKVRLGLVLTGGGARAAYQAGVVRALASAPVDVTAISAVGAGALNGSIVAAADSLADAADRLARLWGETVLSSDSALHLGPLPVLKLGVYLTLLFSSGITPQITEVLQGAISTAGAARTARQPLPQQRSAGGDLIMDMLTMASELINVSVDDELVQKLSREFAIAAGNPIRAFFVSVYESDGGLLETFKLGLQGLGVINAGKPVYRDIASPSLSPDERLRYVLASATLPFVSEAAAIDGRRYFDGSFGGMNKTPGSVPLMPLRNRTDLDALMVVHTEPGVTWDATQFQGVPILEVRPSVSLRDAEMGYFWADAQALRRWIATGERDAKESVSALLNAIKGWGGAEEVRAGLRSAAKMLDQ